MDLGDAARPTVCKAPRKGASMGIRRCRDRFRAGERFGAGDVVRAEEHLDICRDMPTATTRTSGLSSSTILS